MVRINSSLMAPTNPENFSGNADITPGLERIQSETQKSLEALILKTNLERSEVKIALKKLKNFAAENNRNPEEIAQLAKSYLTAPAHAEIGALANLENALVGTPEKEKNALLDNLKVLRNQYFYPENL